MKNIILPFIFAIVALFDLQAQYYAGSAISANSRYLYVSARRKLLQFDLQAEDIAASRVLVGEWNNGESNAPIFYIAALAPDNKIYISGTSSHRYLHVVHQPDSAGLACLFEQRGLALPAYNFATIPNFPNYRQGAGDECDSVSTVSDEPIIARHHSSLYPNPAKDQVRISGQARSEQQIYFNLYNVLGQQLKSEIVWEEHPITISDLIPGMYFYTLSYPMFDLSGILIVED